MKMKSVLIKIGGSLVRRGYSVLSGISRSTIILSNKYRVIVVLGGGDIANVVRGLYNEFHIYQSAAHWMAISAMNINGMLFVGMDRRFKAVETILECRNMASRGYVPVILPYRLLKKIDSLPRSWEVTSDSIALFIAHILNTDHVILLKDVPGIYKNDDKKSIITSIRARELKDLKQSCIDSYLPKLVERYKKDMYIASGLHPERMMNILDGEVGISTRIIA